MPPLHLISPHSNAPGLCLRQSVPELLHLSSVVLMWVALQGKLLSCLIFRAGSYLSARCFCTAYLWKLTIVTYLCRLLLAPHIIESYGWESVFYIFGVLGIFWYIYAHVSCGLICVTHHLSPSLHTFCGAGVLHLTLPQMKLMEVTQVS